MSFLTGAVRKVFPVMDKRYSFFDDVWICPVCSEQLEPLQGRRFDCRGCLSSWQLYATDIHGSPVFEWKVHHLGGDPRIRILMNDD